MPWYAAGTVAVTNGSAVVTGTGTAFVANARAGWALQLRNGSDLSDYEILSVDSATQLTLARPYAGTTQAGRSYQVKPGAGLVPNLQASVEALLAQLQGAASDALAGAFPAGTLAAPGLRRVGDLDTGLWWPAGDALALVTGGVERARARPSGFDVTGLITGTAVMQSPTDATVGRLMVNGAWGWGPGITPLIADASVVDTSILPGLYRYVTASGSSGGPPGVTGAQLLHTRRSASGGETQLMMIETSSDATFSAGAMATRFRVSAGWSAWSLIGIADAGANANGRYLRLREGLQMCWSNGLASLATGELTWTYPASFASGGLTSVVATPSTAGLGPFSPRTTTRGVASAQVSVVGAGGARVAVPVDLFAVGRWFN